MPATAVPSAWERTNPPMVRNEGANPIWFSIGSSGPVAKAEDGRNSAVEIAFCVATMLDTTAPVRCVSSSLVNTTFDPSGRTRTLKKPPWS